MARIFISHASANDADVTGFADWLTEAGFQDHFVDHLHIEGGADWNQRLPMEVKKADIFLLYVSRDWLASTECYSEYRSAYYGGRPVIPLLVADTLEGLSGEDEKRFKTLCGSVQGIAISGIPPNGLTEKLIVGAIEAAAGSLRARKRARLMRTVGGFALAAAVCVAALAVHFRDYLGAYGDQWRITRAFAPLEEADIARLMGAADVPRAARTFTECRDPSICPQMMALPAGQFWMGSTEDGDFMREDREWPRHEMSLRAGLAVSVAEITQAQWVSCFVATRLEEGPKCREIPNRPERALFPAESVSWHDAKAYVAWLNLRVSGLQDGPYRLLSEAEWEYAARGVRTLDAPHTRYFWGNDLIPFQEGAASVCDHANGLNAEMPAALGLEQQGIQCPNNPEMMSAVRSLAPNGFGLYDTAGNVAEWVEDCWYETHDQRPKDPRARLIAGQTVCERVIKGGSWSGVLDNLRVAARVHLREDLSGFNIGFRVARDLTWRPEP